MRPSVALVSSLSLLPFCLATLSVSHAGNTTAANTTCATGVHMIVARASTESPGPGIIGAVATQVQQSVPGSDSESVEYPATLTDYQASEASGVAAMTKLIQSYAQRCPNSKIALLGYSQGAQVAGDVLCGTTQTGFNATQPLDPALSKRIVAVVQMGDPSHVAGLSQDVGNSTRNGIFPRTNTAACTSTLAVTQSFCNNDDRFCDNGTSIPVHLSYVTVFGSQAALFISSKVNGTAV